MAGRRATVRSYRASSDPGFCRLAVGTINNILPVPIAPNINKKEHVF